jgi:putative hydrolase of the HAD superfamily
MGRVKAVIWDLAGVLMHTPEGHFNRTLARRLNVPLAEAVRVMESHENALWDLDEWGDDQFFDFILRELGLPVAARSILESIYTEDCYIDRVMLAYARGMRKTHRTALLTNFPARVHQLMRDVWHAEDNFDHFVASCDVKLLKPDPRIYQLTLARLGATAAETVFVDDTPENVLAAEELGMQAILFRTRGQVLADMELALAAS